MSRRIKRMYEEEQDLNLAPIMNMVIILIPLLLLSVVFITVSVIDVTTPCFCAGVASNVADKPLMTVSVSVQPKGFDVKVDGKVMPPQNGCDLSGPTICLSEQIDTMSQFAQASSMIQSGQRVQGQDVLNKTVAAYNWRVLYNTLSALKHQDPRQQIINISTNNDIPFAATVRLMDTSRNRLSEDSYSTRDAFWNAQVMRDANRQPVSLYKAPMLFVVD